MATPIEDVIHYLRTSGGADYYEHTSYFDQSEIVFFISNANNLSNTEKHFAQAAFQMWAELIDIPMSFSSTKPNIVLSYATDLEANEAGVTRPSFFFSIDHHTEVLINRNSFPEDDDLGLGIGAYGTYLHEIGHALGLSHPGSYDGGAPVYGEDNVYPEDTTQFTVMSYFHHSSDEVPDTYYYSGSSTTPLLHDIATIQSIYGANYKTRSGDTTYGFGSNTAQVIGSFTFDPFNFDTLKSPAFAIWDGGGTDTIDASQFQAVRQQPGAASSYLNQIIDLREGAFSSIGFDRFDQRDDGLVHNPLKNNIAIAFGAVIENAIGGEGDDHLFGNNVSNRLIGNGGDDHIFGFGGDDFLQGGNGNDELLGGDGDDRLFGDGGQFGDGDDLLSGGAGNDILDGGSGRTGDVLDGGKGYDTASYANASSPIVLSPTEQSGEISGDTFKSIEAFLLTPFGDIFHAFDSDDDIDGSGGDDQLFGLGGNDIIQGGAGNDFLDGGHGDDILRGGGGYDTLVGGLGNDQLNGGLSGAAKMSGGDGDDIYLVNHAGDVVLEDFLAFGGSNPGVDLVVSSIDYTLPLGVENLTLSGFGLLTGTGNLRSNHITGNPSGNILDGAGGADVMAGRGGNDTYVVDNAGDVVDETSGNFEIDTVMSSITFNLANTATTRGAVENLTLIGAARINGTGNALANTIIGNSASNVLTGHGGNDRLDGAGGADTMFGGTGHDIYVIDNASDRVDETTGGASDVDIVLSAVSFSLLNQAQTQGVVENITLTGASSINATGDFRNNVLTGNSGDNVLNGGSGHDTLLGGDGSDILDGGLGNDTLDGQDGRDTATFASATAAVFVVLGQNGADGGVIFGNDTLRSIENVIGSNFGDVIYGNEQANTLEGRNGNDRLVDGLGNDIYLGGAGLDVLDFSSAANAVSINMQTGTASHAGSNEVDKFDSIESVIGTQFSDAFAGSSQNDTFAGLGGNDSYVFTESNPGKDRFTDTSGNDNVTFDFRNIEAITRDGNDLVGNLTNGTFTVVNHFAGSAIEIARDVFTGRQVTLAVGLTGGDLPGIIAGTHENETLDGRGGDDLLYGNGGRDMLLGGQGDDLLDGGKGKDVLVGGHGADALIGGKGNDTFVFAPDSGHDIIRDFGNGHDLIDLTAFNTNFREIDGNHHGGRLGFCGSEGPISIIRDHGDTVLAFADGSIRIEDVAHLNANDFLF